MEKLSPTPSSGLHSHHHRVRSPSPNSPANQMVYEAKKNYDIYFLHGRDRRSLTPEQQIEITKFIRKNPLSKSFYVYNSAETVRKLKLFREKLPWIKVHYAIKSNPIPYLIKDVLHNGGEFDCASKNEIKAALEIGAKLQQIIYSNPIKDERELIWAEENNVVLTVADSLSELMKIHTLSPSIQVLWRISIAEEKTDNLSTPFSVKFGDNLETDEQIQSRMQQISEMGIKLSGIHFHCGSGLNGSSGFKKAIALARKCIVAGRKFGHPMDILDIGGGFPAEELPQTTIDAISETKDDPLGYTVYAEPGRHLSGNSCYVLTRVIGKRTKMAKPCYHVNESLYHSFNGVIMDDITFDDQKEQVYSKVDIRDNQKNVQDKQLVKSQIFGMTCDGLDVIAKSIWLPTLESGDWLCFGGMGAYTYGSRSHFNGMSSLTHVEKWSSPMPSFDSIPKQVQQTTPQPESPVISNSSETHQVMVHAPVESESSA